MNLQSENSREKSTTCACPLRKRTFTNLKLNYSLLARPFLQRGDVSQGDVVTALEDGTLLSFDPFRDEDPRRESPGKSSTGRTTSVSPDRSIRLMTSSAVTVPSN